MIRTFPSVYLCSNSYLIETCGHAAVIDPCENEALFLALHELTVDFCLLTHEHYDHINGVNQLKARFQCDVVCSKACAGRIKNPTFNEARYFPAFNQIQAKERRTDPAMIDPKYTCRADQTFEREASFQWQGHSFFLRETPGHSPGSICILVDQKILFSGDTLSAFEAPNTRFPGGDINALRQDTIPFLCGLSPDTVVYPGHYSPFLLKDAVLK